MQDYVDQNDTVKVRSGGKWTDWISEKTQLGMPPIFNSKFLLLIGGEMEFIDKVKLQNL